jgi:tetratricopeptide (TPR) repeat protein
VRTIRNTGLAVAFALSLIAAREARAQDYEAAGRNFAAAQEAFGKGQFAHAAELFEKAYEITKDPVLLYNIGEAYEKANNGKLAVKFYARYVAEQPQATDRPEVERRIGALKEKYHVDAAAAGAAPPPAEVPGQPAAPEKPAAAPEKPAGAMETPVGLLDEDHPSRTKVAAWVGVAATVALLTAGAIFGLVAQSRSDEISRREVQVNPDGSPPKFDAATEQQFKDLASEGRAYDAAGIALLTGAGVVAVISGVLFYVDHRNKAGAAPSALRITPSFGRSGGGLAAEVRF